MKVGIVTVAKGEPKKGYGLEDTIKELEKQEKEYELIHPQDIFWQDGEYYLFQTSEDGDEVLSLKEMIEDIDIFYIRSILGKGISTNKEFFKNNLRLSSLASLGKPMVNELDAINKSKDKSCPCRNLYDLGVIPRTAIFSLKSISNKRPLKYSISRALKGKRRLVIKPTDATGGEGCIPIDPGFGYKPFIDTYRFRDVLMQDRVEGPEYRFWMIGTDFKGAIEREPEEGDFRGNTSYKGEETFYKPSEKEIELALLIHSRHELEVSAIDFKRDKNDDSLKLLEINCYPGWKSYKRVRRKSLAKDVVSHLKFKYSLHKHEV